MSEARITRFYKKNHKKILIVPILLLLLSAFTILYLGNSRGYIINKDVSLKGGISATIISSEQISLEEIEAHLKAKFPESDISVRSIANIASTFESGVIVEATDINNKQLRPALEEKITIDDYSVQELGPSLGQSFFKEMIRAIAFALLFMAIVVFITFRKLIPSVAVILSAILDLTATLAIIGLLDIRLSSAGIAAFLMVIGYSIDTDILLATRVLRRKLGTTYEKINNAFKTGMTMSLTTIAALTVAAVITNSHILRQMFMIIIIALIVDIISTWMMNAGLLAWYEEKRNRKNEIR